MKEIAEPSLSVARAHRVGLWWIVAVLMLGLCGCQPADPLEARVDARDSTALARWRVKSADWFTREAWAEFDRALQEIRFAVTVERAATGREAVAEKMCERINARTVREVLVIGYEAQLTRLKPTLEALREAVDQNALLGTTQGDSGSARYLEGHRERQHAHLKTAAVQIDSAMRRLVALGGRTHDAIANPSDAGALELAPRILSREEARRQFLTLITDQRSRVILKYGERPARIDRDGATIRGADLALFKERREAASENGHAVIAVQVGDTWWIHDAPAALPTFTASVTKNLTPTDWRELKELWENWQAERWARKMDWDHRQP